MVNFSSIIAGTCKNNFWDRLFKNQKSDPSNLESRDGVVPSLVDTHQSYYQYWLVLKISSLNMSNFHVR